MDQEVIFSPQYLSQETDRTFDYYFFIDHRIEKIVRKKKLKYFKIFSSSLKINPLLPIMLAKIILGFLQSLFIFIKYKPNIVVGFGGYTSIPSILAAKILKLRYSFMNKTLLWEKPIDCYPI